MFLEAPMARMYMFSENEDSRVLFHCVLFQGFKYDSAAVPWTLRGVYTFGHVSAEFEGFRNHSFQL